MTVNLEKQLIKANKKIITAEELLIVKEYEQNAGLVDHDVLLRVGLNLNLKGGQKITERLNRNKAETLPFKQERVFHISQIESICMKYFLRFLPSRSYEGTIDKELPFKISNFEAAYSVKCQCDQLRRDFGIVMPTFYIITNPLTGVQEYHTDSNAEKTEPFTQNTFIMAPASSFKLKQQPKDPLFFYKINEEYYYLIHKWGNDLSVFRRFLGLLCDPFNFYLVPVISFLMCTLALLINPTVLIKICFLVSVFSFVASSIIYLILKKDYAPLKNKWNSPYI